MRSLDSTNAKSSASHGSGGFRATFRRKVFGRNASSNNAVTAAVPPTPDLVGDSSAADTSSGSSSAATPPHLQRRLAPIVTDSGKLDFFGGISGLPSEEQQRAKAERAAAAGNNGGGGIVTSSSTFGALGLISRPSATELELDLGHTSSLKTSTMTNFSRPVAIAVAGDTRTVLPSAPLPTVPSPKKEVPARSSSISVEPPRRSSFDGRADGGGAGGGGAGPVFTHRRSTPSEGSLDLGSELMTAVLSIQALDRENTTDSFDMTQDSYRSTSFSESRPSMANTLRRFSDSPESMLASLPPIATGGTTIRFSGLTPPPRTIGLPPVHWMRTSASSTGHGGAGGSGASRRCITEAQMRELDKQAAIYAERVRKERRPRYVQHRAGLFANVVRDEDDSEDDYGSEKDGEDDDEQQQQPQRDRNGEKAASSSGFLGLKKLKPVAGSAASKGLKVDEVDVEPISPTAGAALFPAASRLGGGALSKKTKGSETNAGRASPWDASSDEDEEEEDAVQVRRVRTPEPGLDVPAKRALYTCTLLKIHPHLAPHFLVPGNPAAQPLAAVALAAKDGLVTGASSDSASEASTIVTNALAEVRFPRSTNNAHFLSSHSSTTSLARGGLRIALARAQVMRSLKRRKLPLMQEVEISWFQRKYGSELVAPDRVMAEMGRRPPVSPEALMKPPVASGDVASASAAASASANANPMAKWALRPRFAERMEAWTPLVKGKSSKDMAAGDVVLSVQTVLSHLPPVTSAEFAMVPKAPVLLLSARVCALAGLPVPTWQPPSLAPKRFRGREVAGGGKKKGNGGGGGGALAVLKQVGAPWLSPRPLPSPASSVTPGPSTASSPRLGVHTAPNSPLLGGPGSKKDVSNTTTMTTSPPIGSPRAPSVTSMNSAASAAADAALLRHLKQNLPAALTQNVIAEEEVLADSDEEDLPLSLLQASRLDQKRRAQEALLRQREAERRREQQSRLALERNKAMLAEARERQTKGDVRASVLQAHDYGAGDASVAVSPSESMRDVRDRGHGSESGHGPNRMSVADWQRSGLEAEEKRRASRLSMGTSAGATVGRSVSASNLRSSYVDANRAAGSVDGHRRLTRVPSSHSIRPQQSLLSPPAPASIRQRSPDRSSTMPFPADQARSGPMASATSLLQLQRANSVSGHGPKGLALPTPPSAWPNQSPLLGSGSRTSMMLPLATPPSPYSPQGSQPHPMLQTPNSRSSVAIPGSKMSAHAQHAHERMSAALVSSPSGFPFTPQQQTPPHGMYMYSPQQQAAAAAAHMSMYGGNMQAFQLQQAAAAAMMAGGASPSFMMHGHQQQHQHMQMQMQHGPQPLIALDARHLPPSATVLHCSDTFRH